MDRMKDEVFPYNPKPTPVKILQSEFTPEDILGVCHKEPTLKSLEAYKRVKMFKKINAEEVCSNVNAQKLNQDHLHEK